MANLGGSWLLTSPCEKHGGSLSMVRLCTETLTEERRTKPQLQLKSNATPAELSRGAICRSFALFTSRSTLSNRYTPPSMAMELRLALIAASSSACRCCLGSPSALSPAERVKRPTSKPSTRAAIIESKTK